MLKLILKKLLKISLLPVFIFVFLVLGNLYTYQRLTAERIIGQLTFTSINPQEYDALLKIGNACEGKIYRIYGDEWQIDTQFLKWKSWATLLGFDAMYRLDRLSGRYINIDDENSKSHIAHDLKKTSTLNLSKIAERFDNDLLPIDTIYGSSAYEKMQTDVIYTVSVTSSGILARKTPLTDQANQLQDCDAEKSKWKNTIVMLDQKLLTLIDSFK